MNNWVVVADKGQAKIFNVTKPVKKLEKVTIIENHNARLKQEDLASDRPGRTHTGGSSGTNSFTKGDTAVEQSLGKYAQAIADYIGEGKNKKQFNDLIVVAEAGFLGKLNQHLEHNKLSVVKSIVKDLHHLSDDQILDRIKEDLINVFPPG